MSYGPKQWKTGTLSGIIRRAYDICSTNEALQTELAFIKKVFTEINGYPKFLVDRMLQKFREMQTEADTSENNNTSDEIPPEEADKKQTLILKVPFRGDKGQTLIKSLENTLKRTIEDKINYRIVNTGTKHSRYFSLKDKVNAKHLSNFITPCVSDPLKRPRWRPRWVKTAPRSSPPDKNYSPVPGDLLAASPLSIVSSPL